MNNAKRGQIPPYAIFFLFYISRVVVSLTYIQTISVGFVCADLLISIFCSFVITIILSIPAYLCAKKGINPFDIPVIRISYLIFFIYKTAINIGRFTGFATSRLNPDSTNFFFALLICVAACYCAYLGIEGLSRFSVYAGISIIVAIVFIIIFNVDNIRFINLYPIVRNETEHIIYNTIIMTSNSIEPAVLLCLAPRINGNTKKAFFTSICAEYFTIFVLIMVTLCVLGSSASLQPYPIFTLFQMATGNTLSRLDIVHTAFWILAVFVKCTMLIYCSTMCIKKYTHKNKCIAFTLISFVISLSMTELIASQLVKIAKPVSAVAYLIFCVGIPVFSLIFLKKDRRDILAKSD